MVLEGKWEELTPVRQLDLPCTKEKKKSLASA
jgi:hypothetical protein